MKRKNMVAGNWKMNMNAEDGLRLFGEIKDLLQSDLKSDQEVVICPPYLYIHKLAELTSGATGLSIGAQNCHQADSGAFTGEVSAGMIKSCGAEYVIIGHSERREYFAESSKELASKLDAVLKNGLKPIFCIGETLEQRNNETYFELIESQLSEAAFHLTADQFSELVLAYEPVWAIGTGLTASPEQAQEIHAFIREKVAARYGQEIADSTTILYGGSCNPKNAPELFGQKDIDGGLIGGASLKSRDFVDIVAVFNS